MEEKKLMEEMLKALTEDSSELITVTIKLDKDVVSFFKENSKQYQPAINRVLRAFVKHAEVQINKKNKK